MVVLKGKSLISGPLSSTPCWFTGGYLRKVDPNHCNHITSRSEVPRRYRYTKDTDRWIFLSNPHLVMTNIWKITIYSGFSREKWWFSINMLNHQGVSINILLWDLNYLISDLDNSVLKYLWHGRHCSYLWSTPIHYISSPMDHEFVCPMDLRHSESWDLKSDFPQSWWYPNTSINHGLILVYCN